MKRGRLILLSIAIGIYISCGSDNEEMQPPEHTGSSQAGQTSGAEEKVTFAIGDVAPGFTLPGTPDKMDIVLAEALKEKPVLIAFYPKAFTGG